MFLYNRGALEPETESGQDITTPTAIRLNRGGLTTSDTQERQPCMGEIEDILGSIRSLMHNANYSDTPLQAYIVLMNDAHQVSTTRSIEWVKMSVLQFSICIDLAFPRGFFLSYNTDCFVRKCMFPT